MMRNRIVGNYAPSSVLEGVVFMGIVIFVWPVQDFVAFWRS